MMRAKIVGTGSYAPVRILSNSDLEKMVDTSDEWIQSRTGMVKDVSPMRAKAHLTCALRRLRVRLNPPGWRPRILI